MRIIFDQIVGAVQGYVRYFNNNMQDQQKRRVVQFVIFLTPILASFVYVQMQQQQPQQHMIIDDQSFGYFGYLWTITTLAVATFILSVWHLCLRVVGISLGIGLGLGFAGHVYDALADIQDGGGAVTRDRGGKVGQNSTIAVMPNLPKDAIKSKTVVDDVNSYHYLMRSAGYSVNNGTLRAQMVKGTQASTAIQANNAKRESLAQQQQHQDGQMQPSGTRKHRRVSLYNFDRGTKATVRMKTMWPNLATIVNESLARLIEFVLRDYISSWYSKLDENVVYNDPAEDPSSHPIMNQDNVSTALSINIDNNADIVPSSSIKDTETRPRLSEVAGSAKSVSDVENTSPCSSPMDQHPIDVASHPTAVLQQQRTMILTTTGTQPSPFIDSLYTIFACALGMLATRACENVNVLELLLLHFPHILGQNLRVYRKMKDLAVEKKQRRTVSSPSESSLKTSGSFRASISCQDEEVSEIAIVREYLLAGRFHRALTFGLDVPSLLFADPLAKISPLGSTFQDKFEYPDEDAVLYDRLLSPEARLIDECELDYCRVLAAKLTKMLVPRSESDSSIMNTMIVEMLASCVLGPVLGCFNPDSVNGWIITGLGLLESKNDSTENAMNDVVLETKYSINDEATSIKSKEKVADGFEEDVFDEFVFRDDDKKIGKKVDFAGEGGSKMRAEQIITLLSMTIIELGSFVDFVQAREKTQDYIIDWDAQKCQDSVRHLVLIIEAALLFGVRSHPQQQSHTQTKVAVSQPDDDDFDIDIDDDFSETKAMPKDFYDHSSLSAILMEMTGDIDAFDRQVEGDDLGEDGDSSLHDDKDDLDYILPKSNELSTMRTLIAAWLHSGQVYKVLSIIVRSNQTILQRFYHKHAFLRRKDAGDFTRLLRQLDGINILVDTISVLESQCLLVDNGFENLMRAIQSRPGVLDQKLDPFPEMAGRLRSPSNANLVGSVKANLLNNRNRIARFAQSATEIDLFKDRSMVVPIRSPSANISHAHHQNNHSTPAYLAFGTNEVFASSLRLERERRYASWLKETNDLKTLDFVARTCGMKEKDVVMHRELHHLSSFFSSNTCDIRIEPCFSADGLLSLANSTANITLKGGGIRRVVEVPDDDSSFLLRASPRPLKPMAIQRDQRNPAFGCRVYLAMYEEPAIHPKTKRFYGGRYLRQCLIRYYPNDRTASVTVAQKVSTLDGRTQDDERRFLADEFQKLRHSCLKVAVGGLLSSPMMEPGDFCSTPRMGRVLDFAHRISLFERPMVDLGGKIFIVHDTSSHRADASSLELSDASMTAAIILRGSSGLNVSDVSQGAFIMKVTDDGLPLILLRADREDSPKNKSDARPYRPSFIRAALLVKSAKQEAQSQRLLYCIRNESTKSSAQIKSDEWLQPALTLLEYANSRGNDRQSILQRDLHLGINHVDRAQLRRNGILNPRYPTVLRGLNARVDGVEEVKGSDFDLLGSPLFLFRIRCTAIAEYIGDVGVGELAVSGNDTSPDNGSKCEPSKSRYFREEWTILRSLKDFVIFHKHIKGQVNPIEHSVSAGAKLVGSVSAALGGNTPIDRRRGPLVPSLAQATKAGNLGVSTKRVMERRKMLLEEYLKYLISPNNLLSRCPELLKFLGAYTSISSQIGNVNSTDEYDRVDVTSVELVTDMLKAGIVQAKQSSERVFSANDDTGHVAREKTNAAVSPSKAESSGDDLHTLESGTSTVIEQAASKEKVVNQPCHAAREMARIRAGAIRLKDVRQAIFRLLKDLFDLDNANFFRSRVISVLRTMSVAVAGAQYFNLLLYQNHVKYMNGEWVSGWILYLVNMFWPNGVFYKRGPPVSQDESLRLKVDSKKMIEKNFPDQLRTVLGKHTEKGLDMLHEMLQNRLVLKSMAYMLVDLMLVELFPELNDFVTGAECLEKDA